MIHTAYRHHPSVRTSATAVADVCWRREPAIVAYRKLEYTNDETGLTHDVAISGTPVIVSGVGVFVVSDDGHLRLYKEDLSRAFWERRVQATLYASPIHWEDRFFACSVRGHVIALDLRGQPVWHAMLDQPIYGSPAIDPVRGTIYLSTFGQGLHALDLASGAQRWSAKLPAPWAEGAPPSARDPYAGPIVDERGDVFLTHAEHLSCFTSEGRLRWRLDTGHSVRASAALEVSSRTVVVATTGGEVWLVDLDAAIVRRRVAVGGKLLTSPAIERGLAYVGDQRGRVTAIALADGEIAWISDVGDALDHGSITVTPAGDPVFLTERGNAICLDGRNGGFLWETSQVLGLPLHDRRMNGTPVVSPDGTMVCGAYSGYLYRFRFRPVESVSGAEGQVVAG